VRRGKVEIVVWVVLGQVVLPMLVSAIVLALSPRRPSLGLHPRRTGLGLYVLLWVLTAPAAPGLARWVPVVGFFVSVPVAIGVYLILRRRGLAAREVAAAG
jgi:hypothetical protein